MRPAEILVKLLLNEAIPPGLATPPPALSAPPSQSNKTFAIIHGPKIPAKGYYAIANDWKQLIQQFKAFLGAPKHAPTGKPDDVLTLWILGGYNFLVRREDGQFFFFGTRPFKLDTVGQRLMGLATDSQVTLVSDVNTNSAKLSPGALFL